MSSVERYVQRVLKDVPRALPQRAKIEREVRTHLAESLENGSSEAETVNHMGPPGEVARGYLSEMDLPLGGLGRRAAAFLIDLTLVLAVVVPVALFWTSTGPELVLAVMDEIAWIPSSPAAEEAAQNLAGAAIVVYLVTAGLASLLYFPLLEHKFAQTLGKRMLGIAVVRESGLRVGVLPAVIRRLPLFFEFFWLDALFAPFTQRKQRAFDMVAKTVVVDVSSPPDGVRPDHRHDSADISG